MLLSSLGREPLACIEQFEAYDLAVFVQIGCDAFLYTRSTLSSGPPKRATESDPARGQVPLALFSDDSYDPRFGV